MQLQISSANGRLSNLLPILLWCMKQEACQAVPHASLCAPGHERVCAIMISYSKLYKWLFYPWICVILHSRGLACNLLNRALISVWRAIAMASYNHLFTYEDIEQVRKLAPKPLMTIFKLIHESQWLRCHDFQDQEIQIEHRAHNQDTVDYEQSLTHQARKLHKRCNAPGHSSKSEDWWITAMSPIVFGSLHHESEEESRDSSYSHVYWYALTPRYVFYLNWSEVRFARRTSLMAIDRYSILIEYVLLKGDGSLFRKHFLVYPGRAPSWTIGMTIRFSWSHTS